MIGETDLRVTAVSPLPEGFKDALAARVRTLRGELEAWIVLHPEFRHSLVPVPLSCSAPPPEIVRRMTEASAIAGVGPFAAVAGTIAQMAAESLVDRSPDLIIENGGDIFMYSRRDRVVGLLPDPESGVLIGLNVAASACPLALCASSATIGHSLSFGQGELVLVRSPDGALADALATALCNRLQGPGDVKAVVDYARRFVKHGLTGIFRPVRGSHRRLGRHGADGGGARFLKSGGSLGGGGTFLKAGAPFPSFPKTAGAEPFPPFPKGYIPARSLFRHRVPFVMNLISMPKCSNHYYGKRHAHHHATCT